MRREMRFPSLDRSIWYIVTWGAVNWLPDIRRWADIIVYFLRPGGAFYLAEGHPCAAVFDDTTRLANGMPDYFAPYFLGEPLILNDPRDYADDTARLKNSTTYEWIHPLGKVVTSLLDAGLTLKWLHEHDSVPWRMFDQLVRDAAGMFRWPDRPWLPLAYSLRAERSYKIKSKRRAGLCFPKRYHLDGQGSVVRSIISGLFPTGPPTG